MEGSKNTLEAGQSDDFETRQNNRDHGGIGVSSSVEEEPASSSSDRSGLWGVTLNVVPLGASVITIDHSTLLLANSYHNHIAAVHIFRNPLRQLEDREDETRSKSNTLGLLSPGLSKSDFNPAAVGDVTSDHLHHSSWWHDDDRNHDDQPNSEPQDGSRCEGSIRNVTSSQLAYETIGDNFSGGYCDQRALNTEVSISTLISEEPNFPKDALLQQVDSPSESANYQAYLQNDVRSPMLDIYEGEGSYLVQNAQSANSHHRLHHKQQQWQKQQLKQQINSPFLNDSSPASVVLPKVIDSSRNERKGLKCPSDDSVDMLGGASDGGSLPIAFGAYSRSVLSQLKLEQLEGIADCMKKQLSGVSDVLMVELKLRDELRAEREGRDRIILNITRAIAKECSKSAS